MSGAKIIIKPATNSEIQTSKNTIIGNTVLYGATSGLLLAAGQAGERFAVRNSGATAIIEGCGTNGCEYMTGGTVVILGEVGDNFAAGMTGGMAFVYDPENSFENYVNPSSVIWQRIETDYWNDFLLDLIKLHEKETQSVYSKKIIQQWNNEKSNFYQVCPKEMLDKLKQPLSNKAVHGKAV